MESKNTAAAPDAPADVNEKAASRLPSRRQSARTGLRCAAVIELPGAVQRDVQTCDVSRDGLSVMSTKPISPGTRCTVRFNVPLGIRSPAVKAPARSIYSSYTGPDGFKVGLLFGALDADAQSAIDEFLLLEKP